jgi:hypothetical protein
MLTSFNSAKKNISKRVKESELIDLDKVYFLLLRENSYNYKVEIRELNLELMEKSKDFFSHFLFFFLIILKSAQNN